MHPLVKVFFLSFSAETKLPDRSQRSNANRRAQVSRGSRKCAKVACAPVCTCASVRPRDVTMWSTRRPSVIWRAMIFARPSETSEQWDSRISLARDTCAPVSRAQSRAQRIISTQSSDTNLKDSESQCTCAGGSGGGGDGDGAAATCAGET